MPVTIFYLPMKSLMKILRLLGLICLIFLAAMGVGAPVSFNSREKYQHYQVRTEQVDPKEDETDDQMDRHNE